MKLFSKIILPTAILASGLFLIAQIVSLPKIQLISPSMVMAQAGPGGGGGSTEEAKDAVCDGVALTGGNCNENAGENKVSDLVSNIINILSFVIGVIAVIMIIIGGLKYVMSNGDANSISSAKNTILYAIIGLVVVAMAQTIVRFVISQI